ncbi:hypothetical protein [Maritalea sp.]|uniref:hypothetical protein n=1 Tax=Maritalea sp. TaxID=2003361 RepID=UPI003EF97B31
MESILPLITQLIAGGLAGNGVGQTFKDANLGTMGNTIAGAIGGLGCSALLGITPGLQFLAGMGLVADGVSGLIGGAILTAIVTIYRKMTTRD